MIPPLADIIVRELRHGNRELFGIVWRGLLRRSGVAHNPPQVHLDAAIQWICRAQDATASGGVARSYCIAWNPSFRARGWLAAYPETTGYIIPTMFEYASLSGNEEIRRRAIRMADWEIDVQMSSGAVQGGMIGMPPSPAIFNTGQVIFGWLRAAQETGEVRYLRAAERAGQFLLEHQDADGVWRRGISQYAKAGPQTYNTRTAWALAELAEVTGDARFREAAAKNIESALAPQLPNGWFPHNCLSDDNAPLTHTIAYATRGVLETGALLRDERYLTAAARGADALCARQRPDGSLAGRYDRHWQPAVRWSCLTGNVQVAIVWLRLAALRNERKYLTAAKRSIQYVANLQDLATANDGVRGGIAGAFPIYGDYGRFEYLNWAAKFFAEAIMTLRHCEDALATPSGTSRIRIELPHSLDPTVPTSATSS